MQQVGFIIRIQAPGLFLVLYGNSNVSLLESSCVRPYWHWCCQLVSFDAVRWPLHVNLFMFVITLPVLFNTQKDAEPGDLNEFL